MRPTTRFKILQGYLYLFGGFALLAFGAVVMPSAWMVVIAEFFGITQFPEHPLTWYLARHLSAIYGLAGIGVLIVARELDRYLSLVRWLGWGIIALGVMQLAIDMAAPMPAAWTWGESLSTVLGGALFIYLARADTFKE